MEPPTLDAALTDMATSALEVLFGTPVEHSDSVDDIIQHYGVPGMKWGHRKAGNKPTGPVAVTTTQVPGKKVKAAGGEGHAAHPDAIRTATAYQKSKKSTTDSLSDAELRAMINRLQMEQQYANIRAQKRPAADKFVTNIIAKMGQQQAQAIANQVATKHVTSFMSDLGYPK